MFAVELWQSQHFGVWGVGLGGVRGLRVGGTNCLVQAGLLKFRYFEVSEVEEAGLRLL